MMKDMIKVKDNIKTKRNIAVRRCIRMTISLLTLAMFSGVALAEVYDASEPQKIYSPYVERTQSDANFAEGVYFGDTHPVLLPVQISSGNY